MASPSEVVETTLTEKYNRTWMPDIRELLQNAFDGIAEDFPSLQPFSPRVEGSPDSSEMISELRGRGGESLLFQVRATRERVVLRQRRPKRKPLSRSALLLHSDKSIAKGDLGGFGEGLKICALQLLKHDSSLEYRMWGERWVFKLVPNRHVKCRVLAIEIWPFPDVSSSYEELLEVIVSHPRNDCRQLFDPKRYLRFVPQKVLFQSSLCQFLDMQSSGNAAVLFVNGVYLKESPLLSFSVNLRLAVDKLSPDRDALRVSESVEAWRGIVEAIEDENKPQEVRFEAQRSCLVVLEKCKGLPLEDLKSLSPAQRHRILEHIRFERKDHSILPIKRDAPEKVKQVYRLLNYTPLEMESASYFLEGIDFDLELAKVVGKAPASSIPTDDETRFDLSVLQKAVSFVNYMYYQHAGAKEAFRVKFVDFRILLTEPVTLNGVVHLHGSLFDKEVIRKNFSGRVRGQVLVLLFQMAVVMNPGMIERRLLAQIQFQLSSLVQDPNAQLQTSGVSSMFQTVMSAIPSTLSSVHPTTTTVSPAFASASAKENPSQVAQQKMLLRGNFVPNHAGNNNNNNQPHVHMVQDVDDSVPPMKKIKFRNEKEEDDEVLFVPIEFSSSQHIPPNLMSETKKLRLFARRMVSSVFPTMSQQRCLFMCYLPNSSVQAFFDPSSVSVFLNLFHGRTLEDPRELFTILCHELTHLAGYARHDTAFANAMGKIVLDHSTQFIDFSRQSRV